VFVSSLTTNYIYKDSITGLWLFSVTGNTNHSFSYFSSELFFFISELFFFQNILLSAVGGPGTEPLMGRTTIFPNVFVTAVLVGKTA